MAKLRLNARVVALVGGFLVLLLAVVGWSLRATPPPEGGTLVFSDDFERAEVGEKWSRSKVADPGHKPGTWKIEKGRLLAQKIYNAALWLKQPLPDKVRIEFDARAETETGDVKCEVFGDGEHHQSGYILIGGGWNNTVMCIARQDEHGEDRKQDNRCPKRAGGRKVCVEPGVDYKWTIVRTDDAVRWYLDGTLFLTFDDWDPVMGKHFAFNNWEAKVTYDNLKIYDLGQ